MLARFQQSQQNGPKIAFLLCWVSTVILHAVVCANSVGKPKPWRVRAPDQTRECKINLTDLIIQSYYSTNYKIKVYGIDMISNL